MVSVRRRPDGWFELVRDPDCPDRAPAPPVRAPARPAVQPGSERWDELIHQAMPGHGWPLGDAALEVYTVQHNQGGAGCRLAWVNLEIFAGQLGLDWATVTGAWHVSVCWPPGSRVNGVSWEAHAALRYYSEMIKPGMTDQEAKDAPGKAMPRKLRTAETHVWGPDSYRWCAPSRGAVDLV